MKLAIIGTRGIPNCYGGFEQFAEYLAQFMVKAGNYVTVYNSHNHPYKQAKWNGVNIIHQRDPEYRFGTLGQFIYDLNCIRDCRKQSFDLILQLGYTSSSIWGRFLPKEATIVTNMDGMEWKRSKYNKYVQEFLKYAEKLAVKYSDFLIADSIGIQTYLIEKYGIDLEYIPYGADAVADPNPGMLEMFDLELWSYNMLVARLEPENSIEVILNAVKEENDGTRFLVIGNHNTQYGRYLKKKFLSVPAIKFLGAIYDKNILDNLRYYSRNYFHGHTVGGTNPSLLEAMASEALICAHDNIYNRSILLENANYFNSEGDIIATLKSEDKFDPTNQRKILNNLHKIKTIYSWENINRRYEEFLESCLNSKSSLRTTFVGNDRVRSVLHNGNGRSFQKKR